tara:strand:- start:110 stop:607 length:498 start_codon:yes stop_codon:yes gene_type:complete
MSTTEDSKMGKQEMKRVTKALIVESFKDKGFTAVERSAGAVNYVALKPSEDSPFVIASVYGDRRGSASIWIKDECFEILKDNGTLSADEDRNIKDVSFFKRGMDWQVEIHDMTDTVVINGIIDASLVVMDSLVKLEEEREALKAEKLAKASARADAMEAKRKTPF